jgi:hypothetical protein
MWSRESGLDRSSPLDEHIEELVAFAETNSETIDSLRTECDIDIFCGLFSGDDAQGGFTIEPTLSARLAELRLPVSIDIY